MRCKKCGKRMTCKNSRCGNNARYRMYVCECGEMLYTKEELTDEYDARYNLRFLNTLQKKKSQVKKHNTHL